MTARLTRPGFGLLHRWWLKTGQFSLVVRIVSPSRRRAYASAAEAFERYKRWQSEAAFVRQALDRVPLCASVLAQDLDRAERALRVPDQEAVLLARIFGADEAARFVARREPGHG
ncbi:hypothetical protein DT019_34905 [Streptomyces sp. SDr-06]|uniref:hypothetical protein n=1 Tax=Streptomyces sp. SDr-06 TaxID=2267702 RepID=UPI000DEA01C8|nr:hypothetical protein [Streptomyces sp. SDr-06]RCH64052.1 hypothetical protein DT019_34905 [Streptomyces sp. SDr-06]